MATTTVASMRAGSRFILTASAFVLVACTTSTGVSVTERTATVEGGGSSVESSVSPTVDDDLRWAACTDEAATDASLRCATLEVPLDHSDPASDTIELALVKVPATGKREGAVLFNPGGPGGSGFDPIAASGAVIQQQLGIDRFDLIGFDPRGVDRSNGIRCVDDTFVASHLYLDDTPDTPEEQRLLDESDQGFVDGCKKAYGDTLRVYSTEATARDMDAIRAALGDEQISFLGISYGTYLGAVYATLFPERVRAMVLDSAYEPNGDSTDQQYLTQVVGFEGAFDDWAAWCGNNADCPFSAGDVGARWDALLASLDDAPLSVDGRTVNQSTMYTATGAALYSDADWPVLADALAKAEQGDGAGLLSLADAYQGRNADGTFDTLFQSIDIIECASGIEQQPVADPEALLAKIRQQAPRFGADTTLDDLTNPTGLCADLMPSQTAVELRYSGDGPIVVIGGLNDPATPIRWAKEMTAALGPNARMVTYTGEGHGQLLTSACVTKLEGALLADLELPDTGTTCEPDPVVSQPDWWSDLPTVADQQPLELPAVKAALGLSDTLGYGETWVTSLDGAAADEAWSNALDAAGFDDLGTQDIGIDGVTDHAFLAPNGDLLLLLSMDPTAFDTDDLTSAKSSVPAGKSVVLLAYVPQ
jgi:pimeloyl-ACP methyl ester carboxylesterase